MKAALLTALAEGACGDDGRRAVGALARAVGLEAGASVTEVAEAVRDIARDPVRRDAVREWGERLAGLLADDSTVAGAVAAAMERHTPGSGAAWYGGDHSDFRGGLFLREAIGVQVVIQIGGVVAAPEAMGSLPPRPVGFTGRDGETAALLRALDASAAVLVSAVSGLGGIGKTALAVETAHLACAEGRFPGGVLFVDLHGYDEVPVTADQALRSSLRALGVPAERIPAEADDRAGLYRSLLAERGTARGAVLVLADNASSPDQVRPLLPGDHRHRVLVTSRDRLTQLGARLVPLDQLTPEHARELLDLALRTAEPGDGRVTDDIGAAGRLVGLCGHLPLALQIAAALLVENPGMPVAALADDLAASRDRLAHLDDGERSVRAAFELSYRRLPPRQARLSRLLALAPGPEVSDEVAAVLVGAEDPPAGELRALARAHLVERGAGHGWWRLHDLVRAFGMAVGSREEGEAARERVLDFYCRWAYAAVARLSWLPGKAEPERFTTRGEALGWLDGERAGLVAAAQWVREERFAGTAVRLAVCLGEYLGLRRYFDDWITVADAAREAAHRSGDRVGEAMAGNSLGLALRDAGRAEEAILAHARAVDVHRATGNLHREAETRNNLGLALRDADRVGEAIAAHRHARDLHRAIGNRRGMARAWNNLGSALKEAGRAEGAIVAYTHARELHRAIGNRHGEGRAWANLGIVLYEAGQVGEASDAYGRALEIFREFEDWYEAGQTLHSLAGAHEDAGRPAEARAHWLKAADAYTRANAPTEAARATAAAESLIPSPPHPKRTPHPTAEPPPHTAESPASSK
ncbi:tetratricopeptide repeat protein [Streptomyces phaeolivaceus]|uniref:Tetratricopeptide repeat protein n=1 Tax=Streptomyces phaeolivaceus TaxID=2653200 RepID=A0A5P8KBJ6_9ACTN|nr:tetratricopeptide repeat protein [Streptomyces phaeolivaceus]QFR00385.1 tetratricopeptide repeat protein [Streptomyces phaeolivaceus]